MNIKKRAHQVIDSLPEEPTAKELENAFYGLIDQLKIEEGVEDSKQGRTVSHEEVTQRMSRWLSE